MKWNELNNSLNVSPQWLTVESDEEILYTSTEYDLLLDMMNFSLHNEDSEDTHNGQNYSIQIVEYQPFWEFWVPGKKTKLIIDKNQQCSQ